uniref:Uncharacterized protein n=1 Tax=Tanacetum cinerariifolium TaxID=118510 RepID=A0A6L2P3N3_TANCI|nr:hypothetical protein [Tanacetum cinerariifolium]
MRISAILGLELFFQDIQSFELKEKDIIRINNVVEEEDGGWTYFLGGNNSLETKKDQGSNSGDGGNTEDRVKITSGLIRFDGEIDILGVTILRHTGSHYLKTYWEHYPKTYWEHYPKTYWVSLPEEILGALPKDILGALPEDILGIITRRHTFMYLGNQDNI